MRTKLAVLAGTAGVCLAAAPAASPHAGHGVVQVAVAQFKYEPGDASIVVGDSVLWNWNGPDTNHSVTADDGQVMNFDSDGGKSASQVSHPTGDGFGVTFQTAGAFSYHCKVHSFMHGTVSVSPAPPGTPPPPPPDAAPTLSKVSVKPKRFCTRCAKPGTTVRFTLDFPASVRALLRRRGKTVKEIDFAAPPGESTKKLKFRKLRDGKYVLRLVALDNTSGKASKPVDTAVRVRG
jgi:plastocyanin